MNFNRTLKSIVCFQPIRSTSRCYSANYPDMSETVALRIKLIKPRGSPPKKIVVSESLPTLNRADEAHIMNTLWKNKVNPLDEEQSRSLIAETVRDTYPTLSELQAREVENKIYQRLIEKSNGHRFREETVVFE